MPLATNHIYFNKSNLLYLALKWIKKSILHIQHVTGVHSVDSVCFIIATYLLGLYSYFTQIMNEM